MSNQEIHEEQILKNEKSLKELILQVENLQRETQELFTQLNICPEQFASYLENKENFSQAEWTILQEQKKKLDEKLDLALENIPNPAKKRKAFCELNMSRNWLFVR